MYATSKLVDGTTCDSCNLNLEDFVKRLKHELGLVIEWFESNSMKLNKDKCNFLLV